MFTPKYVTVTHTNSFTPKEHFWVTLKDEGWRNTLNDEPWKPPPLRTFWGYGPTCALMCPDDNITVSLDLSIWVHGGQNQSHNDLWVGSILFDIHNVAKMCWRCMVNKCNVFQPSKVVVSIWPSLENNIQNIKDIFPKKTSRATCWKGIIWTFQNMSTKTANLQEDFSTNDPPLKDVPLEGSKVRISGLLTPI